MARGATYSLSSGPVSPRLQPVATGVDRLDPFFASSDLFGPPCVSLCHASLQLDFKLLIFAHLFARFARL